MDMIKIKIAIVTQSLANGGAERSCALLSKIFSQLGFEVHTICVLDEIEYEYSGTIFNLGLLKNKDNSIFGRFQRLLALKRYLKRHNFDWIIDSRIRTSFWSEWIISRMIYNPKKTLYMVRSYDIKKYFPKYQSIAKAIYKNSPYIITVSDAIKEVIETSLHYQNVVRIYNPVDSIESLALVDNLISPQNYIIAYGRIMDEVKNFTLLIDAYAISDLPRKGILLYIVGDGNDVEKLKHKVNALQLQDKIIFKPKTSNPFPIVKSALYTVLSSHYEGFPRVLIESLALGTPVISVDCNSGPREIIQNEYNGLLVENYNPTALSQAMNRLVEDELLYAKLKSNAKWSVAHLSTENISKQWEALLKK
jgi:glycosyltransferase involved in cell wall biosynthesis